MRPHGSRLVRALAIVVTGIVASALAPVGCAGSAKPPGGAASASSAGAPSDAGLDADAAPAERPFAGSAGEATQLIGAAVDKRSAEVMKCVNDYRVRKKLPHERVEIVVGIDQEGRLLGATMKRNKTDAVLTDCVTKALTGAPFPRSHAGVIEITKTFEEIIQ